MNAQAAISKSRLALLKRHFIIMETSGYFLRLYKRRPFNDTLKGESIHGRLCDYRFLLSRNPEALLQTSEKYGNYCRTVARNILPDRRDAGECVSGAWLNAWNAMPGRGPDSPERELVFGLARY